MPARAPVRFLAPLPLALLLALAAPGPLSAREALTTTGAIRAEDLRERVTVLASDAFEGREAGTAGGRAAARYLAEEFARAGLEPRGEDGSWFQRFAIERPVLEEGNRLAVETPDGTRAFEAERDWNPFSASPSGEAEGEVVFAGYGITAPRRDWDDYEGIDVRGKVVLVLRKDPGWRDRRHAAFVRKVLNAAEHGAAALLLCNDPATTGAGPDRIQHWSAPTGAAPGSAPVPYAFVSQEVARCLLEPSGLGLEEAEAALREDGPAPRSLPGVRVSLRVALGRTEAANAQNVVGYLEGRDPEVAHEVVVLGAHFDHVGRGWFGSVGGAAAAGRVHPGADDNASGCAALCELGEYFATPGRRPRRSLLFLAFSGEELGLLGSRHYVDHPLLPLADVVAMLNMDMVGRCRDGRLHVGGVGTGAGLQELVAGANEEVGLHLTFNPQGSAPSDSIVFFRREIPVLFFFTGIHADYHRPTDTPDRLAYAELERVTALVAETAEALAERPERLAFTVPPPRPRPPRLGIALSRQPDPRGVGVEAVAPGGPASAAGLEAGDVIVGLAGEVVRSPADLLALLRRLEAGREVEVVVLRDEDRRVLRIVPARREGR